MIVDFEFNIDDKVVCPLGKEGIVTSCVLDNTGDKQYWINFSDLSRYWREDQLRRAL